MKHKIWNINVAARDWEQTASNQKVNDFPLHNLAYSNTGTAIQRSVVFPDNYQNRSRFWLDCTFEDIKIFFLCVKYIQCNTISPHHTVQWVTVLFKKSLRGSLRAARSTVQISKYSGVQDGLYSKSHSKLTITNYWRIKLSVISNSFPMWTLWDPEENVLFILFCLYTNALFHCVPIWHKTTETSM